VRHPPKNEKTFTWTARQGQLGHRRTARHVGGRVSVGKSPKVKIKVPPAVRSLLPNTKWSIAATTSGILPLERRLRPAVKRLWPDGSERDISWLTADLAALWEVSRVHMMLVRKLIGTANGSGKQRVLDISTDLEVNWFSNASNHMRTMKRELRRLNARPFSNPIGAVSSKKPRQQRPRAGGAPFRTFRL
jgi:hypothetical protein